MMSEAIRNIWAKFSKDDPSEWHPLIYHILDTTAVAQVMWEYCLSESFKNTISDSFGLTIDGMGNLLSFWIGLHDIGKAGPEFQKKNIEKQIFFEALGFSFPSITAQHGFHATATTIILRNLFSEYPRKFRNGLAFALGGHHGEFPDDGDIVDYQILNTHVGDEKWQQLQREIVEIIRTTINPPIPQIFPDDKQTLNPILLLLTGITTTADWIASNQAYFPYIPRHDELQCYLKNAKVKAKNALIELGWFGWRAKHEILKFDELFPGFFPNEIQKAVIEKTPQLKSPFMMIIEAATGSGKTEAALYIADNIIQKDLKAGLYIAMPTQATSNQMYSRVRAFLSKRYADSEINLHLVHGAAHLLRQNSFTPENIYANEEANITSHSWFLPRKKTLLAPFGVGTVDQTFLSVLRTRHFFLRLFGLSHKVLIFDEVHAYDVYMMEIFEMLLQWLHAVGTSVIILTATLPIQTRMKLLRAYSKIETSEQFHVFPRISIADDEQVLVETAGTTESRTINLEWIDQETSSIINKLKIYLVEGGCAAVICNRVNRAQEVYEQISQAFAPEETEIILFHSRFPHKWRMEIENKVIDFFGKNRQHRPKRAILVATQVIEQSLDLDFDLLLSDLAPIDLLIQRIGRLHRHQADSRPEKLTSPVCVIAAPAYDQKIPAYGNDSFVYDAYLLAKTHLILKDKVKLDLPVDSDSLIEFVYSLEDVPWITEAENKGLIILRKKMLSENERSREKSKIFLIPGCANTIMGSLHSFFGDDQNSLSSKAINAPTREMQASINIICLSEEPDGLHIVSQGELIDLNMPISYEQVIQCLESSLSLNRMEIIQYFLAKDVIPPKAFKEWASLRWHIPVVFSEGVFKSEHFELTLDKSSGLRIMSKK